MKAIARCFSITSASGAIGECGILLGPSPPLITNMGDLESWISKGYDPDKSIMVYTSLLQSYFDGDIGKLMQYIRDRQARLHPMPDPDFSLDEIEAAQELLKSLL